MTLNALDFKDYLDSGLYATIQDDHAAGEQISIAMAKRIVDAFNQCPQSPAASDGLGILALVLGIAQWGVKGPGLPSDPEGKDWHSVTGEDSGKHLMSYAVGGVGISHADVGDLADFIAWVAGSGLVPDDRKEALLRLLTVRYRQNGVLYDEVRAAGRCHDPAMTDLLGEPFAHYKGPAPRNYCVEYNNSALRPDDWMVFRTWMRVALRTEKGQRYLLDRWIEKYWRSTVSHVPQGEGRVEEMLVNVRVRNSLPSVADQAIKRDLTLPGEAGRVQRQLDAYQSAKANTAQRRWKIMLRPVVLYRHLSGLPPLVGVGL